MLIQQSAIPVVALASALGGNIEGSSNAPFFLKEKFPQFDWKEIITPQDFVDKGAHLVLLNQKLSFATEEVSRESPFFLSFGGDHSMAIGTWSGAHQIAKGDLGLIWFDAHMDAHTPETSETGNIHGMPLAVLLGHGDPRLTSWIKPYKPENVVLIGIRSFENGEAELLKRLNVRIFFMDEVKEKGIQKVCEEALAIVTQNTVGYGISFDLDCIDPTYFASVSTPVPDGIDALELLTYLSLFKNQPPVGLEIVEYNPDLDQNQVCLRFIEHLIDGIIPIS